MTAQAYYAEGLKRIVRIFPSGENYGIADLPLAEPTNSSADDALRKMRLVRRSRWVEISCGRECHVSFAAPKKVRP